MTRYNDDMVNKLVRDALKFEKKKKFEDALNIYEELALQGIEFAIDRIPIAKHRLDNYKLRKVDFYTSIIAACVVGLSIVTISSNTAMNLMTYNNLSATFAFDKLESQKGSPFKLDVNYHSINNTQLKQSSEFEIIVPQNINRNTLTDRVIEAVETYKDQSDFSTGDLRIDIKINTNNSNEIVGYIHFNAKKPTTCDVFTLRGKL